MAETRDFHIGDILTITSDRVVTPNGMDGIYQILNWMTGDNLFTHQLSRAAQECIPALRAQHPDLAGIAVPEDFDGEAAVFAWLDDQVARYGKTRPVAPLNPGDHTRIDPITELQMIRPDMPIIAVECSPEEPTP